ncbi:hypothetical protein DSM100688_0482 [Bifidobacterium ramosum]|uniref:DUF2316 family protein n=1 Tax=Bifidobacterium ramosum TaxID=1798158 RepID=A0A6L4X3Y4_9BIFI|nr:DUF2316 family protein [Bifidobacterium ramosum]KAB8289402.1 hypothetical protein DSM100688_0482 [Bifidobacterium ramosum]NEG71101.1 DUF2316 family protein [Bifidobacterium ramosum]
MSLTSEQRAATIREFRENMALLGLTAERIGADFGVPGSTIERIIGLRSGVLEYPWIVRRYLLDKAAVAGVEPVPFSALRGDPHDYWFLDDRIIDANRLD